VTTEEVVSWFERLDKFLDGRWEEFAQWISDTIGLVFRWSVCPRDTTENRVMVVSLVPEDIK